MCAGELSGRIYRSIFGSRPAALTIRPTWLRSLTRRRCTTKRFGSSSGRNGKEKEMNEDQMTLVCLVAWAITGALIGFLCGKARGQEAAGALLGALFGPLGWLVTFALADRRA